MTEQQTGREVEGTCTDLARCCGSRRWRVAAGCAAVVICTILMTAAVAKLAGPSASKLITLGGADYLLDTFVGPIELALVMAILLGFRLRACWMGVAMLFGGFTGYSTSYLLADKSCGCFGTLLLDTPFQFLMTKGVSTAIDVVFVAAAVGLLVWRGGKRWPIAALVLAVASAGAGYAYAEGERARSLAFIEEERAKAIDGALQDVAPAPGETSDPTPAPSTTPARDAMTVLLGSPLLEDIRTQAPGGPAWYIFVYDPGCSECMEKHPYVEMDQMRLRDTNDPILQVRLLTKQEIEAAGVIDFWGWPTGATMLVIRDGVLTNVYSHDHSDESPLPDRIYEQLEMDDLPPNYPLATGA